MPSDDCTVCGNKIQVMIFRWTGVCSELCRKRRDNQSPVEGPDADGPGLGVEQEGNVQSPPGRRSRKPAGKKPRKRV